MNTRNKAIYRLKMRILFEYAESLVRLKPDIGIGELSEDEFQMLVLSVDNQVRHLMSLLGDVAANIDFEPAILFGHND